jgi:hypothetical protein
LLWRFFLGAAYGWMATGRMNIKRAITEARQDVADLERKYATVRALLVVLVLLACAGSIIAVVLVTQQTRGPVPGPTTNGPLVFPTAAPTITPTTEPSDGATTSNPFTTIAPTIGPATIPPIPGEGGLIPSNSAQYSWAGVAGFIVAFLVPIAGAVASLYFGKYMIAAALVLILGALVTGLEIYVHRFERLYFGPSIMGLAFVVLLVLFILNRIKLAVASARDAVGQLYENAADWARKKYETGKEKVGEKIGDIYRGGKNLKMDVTRNVSKTYDKATRGTGRTAVVVNAATEKVLFNGTGAEKIESEIKGLAPPTWPSNENINIKPGDVQKRPPLVSLVGFKDPSMSDILRNSTGSRDSNSSFRTANSR